MLNEPIWSVGESLADGEKKIIERALAFFHHNKTATARSLGISIRGLDGKIKRHGIEVKDGRKSPKAN